MLHMHDAIVVGGSYAGLAAALQLARARRDILVIDAGQRRNRFASHSHGYLTQDGIDPAAIAATARAQVAAYPNVGWRPVRATRASGSRDDFSVTLETGETVRGRRLILALGVNDELPGLPGLAERWGSAVFHCPYCHGYELGDGPIGVLSVGPNSIHQALMLPDWGKTTYLLNGQPEPSPAELAELAHRGAEIERTPVVRLVGDNADAELADGRILPLKGLFTATRTTPQSDLAAQLGCDIADHPGGTYIATDAMKATTVPGVFATGDAARPFGSVTFAVGDGAQAGFSTHRSLLFPDM